MNVNELAKDKLNDAALDEVSGGEYFTPLYCGCSCGWSGYACSGAPCPLCGARTHLIGDLGGSVAAEPQVLCPWCRSPVPLTAVGGPCPICRTYLPLTLLAVETEVGGRLI